MTIERTNAIYGSAIAAIIIALFLGAVFMLTREHRAERSASMIAAVDSEGYTDLAGNPVSLAAYAGTVRVIYSWASWCPSCAAELPALASLAADVADEATNIAINRKEPVETARAFLASIGDPAGLAILLDPADHFYTSIGGYSMPELQIYDRDGVRIVHERGSLTVAEARALIERALEVQ